MSAQITRVPRGDSAATGGDSECDPTDDDVEQPDGSKDETEGQEQLSVASAGLSNEEPACDRSRQSAPRMPPSGPGRSVSGLFVHGGESATASDGQRGGRRCQSRPSPDLPLAKDHLRSRCKADLVRRNRDIDHP